MPSVRPRADARGPWCRRPPRSELRPGFPLEMLQHSDRRDAVIEALAWFMITVRASEASEHATDGDGRHRVEGTWHRSPRDETWALARSRGQGLPDADVRSRPQERAAQANPASESGDRVAAMPADDQWSSGLQGNELAQCSHQLQLGPRASDLSSRDNCNLRAVEPRVTREAAVAAATWASTARDERW